MEFRTNCKTNSATITISPFGGILHPKEDGQKQLVIFDRSDDQNWMMLTPSGTPVPHTQLGETVVRRWFWNGAEPLEITGAWLTEGSSGSLMMGSRAHSTFADLLITEATVRVGLSRPPTVRFGLSKHVGRGPWVSNAKAVGESSQAMTEAGPGWVYGACFKLEEITWIKGTRAGIAFGGGAAALTADQGNFSRQDDQGDYVKVGAPGLAAELVAAIAACPSSGSSEERDAFLEGLVDRDFTEEFGGRREFLLEIPD